MVISKYVNFITFFYGFIKYLRITHMILFCFLVTRHGLVFSFLCVYF